MACHLGVLAHLPTIGVGKNVPSYQNLSLRPFSASCANQFLFCLHVPLTVNLGCMVFLQLHHVDGLDHSEVRRSFQLKENEGERVIKLVGNSGFTWGVVSDFALNICQ